MTILPVSRHDPTKSVLFGSAAAVDWGVEPAVCGYRKLTYDNRSLAKTINVPISATPAVVSGVGVVVASDDGYVRLFDPPLRREFWNRRLGSSIYASVVVDPQRRNVIVASTGGHVQCIDLRGTLVWAADVGGQVRATPLTVAESGLLVVPVFGGRCVGLSLETGTFDFDVPIPSPWYAAHGGLAGHRDPYASPVPTGTGGVIVCSGETVLCLDQRGDQRWSRDIGCAMKASPVVFPGTGEVIVFTAAGDCVFLDPHSGAIRGSVCLGSKITASPAVSGDVIAVGVQVDVSFGVDAARRAVSWRSDQGAPRSYTSFTVLPNGDFMAVNGRGNIVCLERDSGRFRWESSQVLGFVDHEPAMDITPVAAADGNMYCGSYGGDLYRFLFKPTDGSRHVD